MVSMLKWYEETGENEDVVISSRVRLARNLSKYPFPIRLSKEQAKNLLDEFKAKLATLAGRQKLQISFYGCNIRYR